MVHLPETLGILFAVAGIPATYLAVGIAFTPVFRPCATLYRPITGKLVLAFAFAG